MKKYILGILIFLFVVTAGISVFAVILHVTNGKNNVVSESTTEQNNTKNEITNEQKEAEEKYNISSELAESCFEGDIEFAGWMYDNYEEVCKEIIYNLKQNLYTERIWYEETGKTVFVLKDEYKGLLDSEQTMRENNIYQKECADNEIISLSFAGDISFANDYLPAQNYNTKGIDGAFGKDLQKTMKEADIFMLNNEFAYTTRGTPVPKGYNFRAEPSKVNRLEEMGVDIVSIANNHAYDFGEDGFLDTIDTLNKANMPYVGGGANLEDAKSHIVYFIVNGMKIGYIAASQVERDEPIFTKAATEDSAGVVRCFEPELVNDMIRDAKENCDFVIVYPHWGTEKVQKFEKDQQALAHSFIDAGADAVIGGHTHRLQGFEFYKGVPIFYSLSNFSFSSKVIDSCVLNLELTLDGIKQIQFIPCMENNGITIQCEKNGRDFKRIIELENNISDNAVLDEKGIVTEK